MSRRVLIWLLLVIVLVSLNWFRSAKAQTPESLSDDEKQYLLEKYKERSTGKAEASFYKTPELYGETEKDSPGQVLRETECGQINALTDPVVGTNLVGDAVAQIEDRHGAENSDVVQR